jgi:pimeloyl-ACP methyl ester carboxylesterase
LTHQFLTLKDGFKFHYVCNDTPDGSGTSNSDKHLVFFLHGFPDSWAVWRHVLLSSKIRADSIIVAVDLPGYGGSDGMEKYGATQVLESLTEFIVGIRDLYGIDKVENSARTRMVIIAAHDWGAVLGFRLADEAPQLADRFILSNGPLVSFKPTSMVITANVFLNCLDVIDEIKHCPFGVIRE